VAALVHVICQWTHLDENSAEEKNSKKIFPFKETLMSIANQLCYTWPDNKVRDLISVEVLHTSLLNITVVAFRVLPLGSYAPMPAPSPPFKTILELVL
jgi:hypothetical protein